MKPFTNAEREHADAWATLKAAGFSNQACLELLTKRAELRDEFMRSAMQGLIAACASPNASDPFDPAIAKQIVDSSFLYADLALRARTTVRDSERPT